MDFIMKGKYVVLREFQHGANKLNTCALEQF